MKQRKRGAIRQLWLPEPARFWARVDKHGPRLGTMSDVCWLWSGWRGESGYGHVKGAKDFATLTAHRVAWELENGPIPEDVLVLHQCDNRPCCRPSHLFLGSDKTNSDDKKQKGRGRWARGAKQHLAKLDEKAVRHIRRERAKDPPTPLETLARQHGVSLVAVSCVALRKTWKHVN